MLGIFLFVFCGQTLQEVSNFVGPGVHGYWQAATPPDPAAAAFAKQSDEAANYLSCLKDEMTGTAKRVIGSYEAVGHDHSGGALLTVTGYKIFVAGVAFAQVLERHIKALIGNYDKLEAHVKTSTSQPLAAPEVVNNPVPLSNNAEQSAASPKQPKLDVLAANNSLPGSTAENSTVADQQKVKAVEDLQEKAAEALKAKAANGNRRAKQLGFAGLGEDENSVLASLASMDPSEYEKFLAEWNSVSAVPTGFFGVLKKDKTVRACAKIN